MAVKLRLMRMGKTKQPTYRVVAADSRSPRNGRFIEIVGTYEPRQEPTRINVDNEKAVAWLRKGAQPTDRVLRFLDKAGVMPRPSRSNPQKAEPGTKAKERAAARAEKEAAANAPAEAPAAEAGAESA